VRIENITWYNPFTMKASISGLLLLILAIDAAPFPLDSVLARGDSCLNVAWTPDSTNTRPDWYRTWGSLCTGSDTIYRHCDFKPGDTYRGICYSYGGEDPYLVFRDKVNRGFLVGSHLCHYSSFGDPTSVVAGADCSGFVCYVWNVPRVATGTLAQKYSSIEKAELAPGDILVKASSHTVLIVETVDPTHFLIWESTSAVNGCRERIIDINAAEWSAYVARRNNSIISALPINQQQLSRPSLCRITASRDGMTFLLNFSRPFRGTIEVRNTGGKAVCLNTISAAAGTVLYPLEKPLACGTYIASVNDIPGTGGLSVPFSVIR
jgi:hypothetical protein